MLKTLRIRSLAVIDDLTVEFGPGLNLLTGETGAGKSILVDALGLAAGDRADAALVRSGAERAVVEAAFGGAPWLRPWLEERGIDPDEDLVVRREIAAGGGGRVFLNGSPAPLAVLRELGDRLVELHGQHEHQGLLRAEHHLDLLDQFGGHAAERARTAEAAREVEAALAEEARLEAAARDREARIRELGAVVREIDAVAPRPGESDELDRERHVLRHAGRMAALLEEAVGLLHDGEPSATGMAAQAARRLAELAGIDPALEDLSARAEAARLELGDLGAQLRDYRDRADFDPARLEAVEARRAALAALRLRHGADEAAILARREEAAAELAALRDLEAGRSRAAQASRGAEEAWADAAAALSARRAVAAERMAAAVEAQLGALALPRAVFRVSLRPGRPGASPRGAERAEFLLSANPGEEPRPLARIASGGELSRIMLALHLVLEGAGRDRVLVFDEVDAGVGGAVADAVGARLAKLARRSQVLCVTHLPQVAAHADRHYHVRKRTAADRTRAEIALLSPEERVDELARMLGGREVTEAGRRHAADLLAAAAGTGTGARTRAGRRA